MSRDSWSDAPVSSRCRSAQWNFRHRAISTALALWCALTACALLAVAPATARTVHIFKSEFGTPGSGSGQFTRPTGIAVNDVTHDIYVVDSGHESGKGRVEEFDPNGGFIAEFNGSSTPAGAFSNPTEIAIDNSGNSLDPSVGDVYVVDGKHEHAVVDKFTATGTYVSQITGTTSGLFEENVITGIAVDPSGEVWIAQNGNEGQVDDFSDAEPNKFETAVHTAFGETSSPGLAVDSEHNIYFNRGWIAKLNSTGEIILSNPWCGGEARSERAFGGVAVNTQAGEAYIDSGTSIAACTLGGGLGEPGSVIERFGSSHLTFAAGRVAVDGSSNNVYATNASGNNVTFFEAVVLPQVSTGEVTEQRPRSLTLNGSVNPEGHAVGKCEFEYDTKPYLTESEGPHGTNVPCSPSNVGTGSTPIAVSAHLTGLAPETIYYYRLVAENAALIPSRTPGQQVAAGPIIGDEFVTAVTASSATLRVPINPNGDDTHYYFSYGTTTAYGDNVPVEPPGADLGGGISGEVESVHIQGLQSGQQYHYRVFVEQGGETFEGSDGVFRTRRVNPNEFTLPDGRAWELVSPADKGGALVGLLDNPSLNAQVASGGSAIAYNVNEPIGEDAEGRVGSSEILSRHGEHGWSSRDISAPHAFPPEGAYEESTVGIETFYVFSPDLSQAVFEPKGVYAPQISGVRERTDLLRDNVNETYSPLVTNLNVPAGTKIAGDPTRGEEQMTVEAVSKDFAHVVIFSRVALAEGAHPTGSATENLYMWTKGTLKFIGTGRVGNSSTSFNAGMTQQAISNDGRLVVIRSQGEPGESTVKYEVRDTVADISVPFGGGSAYFEAMSANGRSVFYLKTEESNHFWEREQGELYVFNPISRQSTDITASHLEGETDADVQNTIVASEDGTYVYLVALGSLATHGGTPVRGGVDNLYVMHEEEGRWTTTYITTLGSEDRPDWRPGPDGLFTPSFDLRRLDTRVSPDGRYLTFMSSSRLTGYDNIDVNSGHPDEEVYLFSASQSRLVCASCNPTGARPLGARDSGSTGFESGLLIDEARTWEEVGGNESERQSADHWVAGVLPTAWSSIHTVNSYAFGTYQPRYLFDTGRLFFNSTDALVPQDTNGTADVYEYEPTGVGGCASESTTFSEASDGCVNLISSGLSPNESAFADASEGGDDAFFVTDSRLVAEDRDTAYDLYDAHVCSVGWQCLPVSVSPPPCTSGDSCKATPSPQPEVFGSPPTQTFSGAGNVVQRAALRPRPKIKPCPRGKTRKRGRCRKKKGRVGKRGQTRRRAGKATRGGIR